MESILKIKINPAYLIGTSMIWFGTTITAHASVIINEVDYDQAGSDTAEFIELYNSDITPVTLDGYTLQLVNGSGGSVYDSFDLSGLSIDANSYLVLCDDTLAVANCDIDVASSGWIQNGGSDGDAIALLFDDTIVDSIAYEEIGTYLGSYGEGSSFTEADSNSITMSIARLPNGLDTNINSSDFGSACITPGSANISGTGNCSISVNPVPVPAAIWLFGSGMVGLIGMSIRKQSSLAG